MGNGEQCRDVNECLQPRTCHRNAFCINKPGTFKCKCKPGFNQHEDQCVRDKLEDFCSQVSCNENQVCIVNPYSKKAKCVCSQGFMAGGKNNCIDIDECTIGIAACGLNSTCVNQEPGYYCKCKVGFYRKKVKKNSEAKHRDTHNVTCVICDPRRVVVARQKNLKKIQTTHHQTFDLFRRAQEQSW